MNELNLQIMTVLLQHCCNNIKKFDILWLILTDSHLHCSVAIYSSMLGNSWNSPKILVNMPVFGQKWCNSWEILEYYIGEGCKVVTITVVDWRWKVFGVWLYLYETVNKWCLTFIKSGIFIISNQIFSCLACVWVLRLCLKLAL